MTSTRLDELDFQAQRRSVKPNNEDVTLKARGAHPKTFYTHDDHDPQLDDEFDDVLDREDDE